MGERVSILIPVFNRERMVTAAISSALRQTYGDVEIIASDNASTDGTWQILESFARNNPRLQIFRNDANLGPIENWRCCLRRATGRWIKFLYSDDVLSPSAVSLLHAKARAQNARGAINAVVVTDEHGKSRREHRLESGGTINFADYVAGVLMSTRSLPVSPGCGLFRREDVETALAWAPRTILGKEALSRGFGPDLLIYLVSLSRGHLITVDEILSEFRMHEGCITQNTPLWQRSLLYRTAFVEFPDLVDLRPKDRRFLAAALDASAVRLLSKYPSLVGALVAESWQRFRIAPVDVILRQPTVLGLVVRSAAATAAAQRIKERLLR